MPPLRLSIIIPVVDEAPTLGACIANARSVADEVIVSDGGSSDGSPELAREAGARVVKGSAGRGAQLNRGAAAADGDVLLFLHADTVLPKDSRVQIEGALAAGFDGGGSKIRFDAAGALLRFGAGW
ncbi:MAG: glycosyltransferase, partial [Acidobacteria bacterium]|nr:glycosyltransferase [Acidobacteriota bacterium]